MWSHESTTQEHWEEAQCAEGEAKPRPGLRGALLQGRPLRDRTNGETHDGSRTAQGARRRGEQGQGCLLREPKGRQINGFRDLSPFFFPRIPRTGSIFRVVWTPGWTPVPGAVLARADYCTFAVSEAFALSVNVQVFVFCPL